VTVGFSSSQVKSFTEVVVNVLATDDRHEALGHGLLSRSDQEVAAVLLDRFPEPPLLVNREVIPLVLGGAELGHG
jgi:hypothetical protein